MSKRKKIEIEKFDEHKITELLRERFAPPEWAFFAQMSNGTGGNYSRIADGFAMSLYPSKGLQTVQTKSVVLKSCTDALAKRSGNAVLSRRKSRFSLRNANHESA